MNPVEWIEHVPERYRVDKRELGKVMIVASTALLVVAVHSVFVFQDAMSDVNRAEEKLSTAEAKMSSSGFNQSLQAIQSLDTYEQVNIYNHFREAAESFSAAKEALNSIESASEHLEASYRLYQWLVLISILGEVAGFAIIYI
ncbi:MAG: hypothetical protein ABEJ75_01990 [Candidatus Nanohaloarchaea archaeon]